MFIIFSKVNDKSLKSILDKSNAAFNKSFK